MSMPITDMTRFLLPHGNTVGPTARKTSIAIGLLILLFIYNYSVKNHRCYFILYFTALLSSLHSQGFATSYR